MPSIESAERGLFRPEQLENQARQEIEHNVMLHGDSVPHTDRDVVAPDGTLQRLRTYNGGNLMCLRAFDSPNAATDGVSETPTLIDLKHERGDSGQVARTRISRLQIADADFARGTGDHLLQAAQTGALNHGASEIYHPMAGSDPRIGDLFRRQGFSFRPGSQGGAEAYRRLI